MFNKNIFTSSNLNCCNIFQGSNGAIILNDDRIIIKRSGFLSLLRFGLKGEKEVYINNITSIQFKANGFLSYGYIQILFVSGAENQENFSESNHKEVEVKFLSWQEPTFKRLKDILEQRINNFHKHIEAPIGNDNQITPTEEIEKLANLMERGLITEEEFQTRKRQILGL